MEINSCLLNNYAGFIAFNVLIGCAEYAKTGLDKVQSGQDSLGILSVEGSNGWSGYL